MAQKEKDNKRFITPSGAGLAAICFFLPWIRACGQDISGVQIANNGESALWLVFLAAVAVVVAFFIYDGQNNLKKLKPLAIGSVALSFLILLIKYAQIRKQGGGMFEIQYGSIGTFLGFVASLIGLQYLEDTIAPPANKFCTQCGEANNSGSSFCNQCGTKIE